jgi:hypothetical protein
VLIDLRLNRFLKLFRKSVDGRPTVTDSSHVCDPHARGWPERRPTRRAVSGKNWFAYFRFHQPTEAYFDRSWPLLAFEQVSSESGAEHAA